MNVTDSSLAPPAARSETTRLNRSGRYEALLDVTAEMVSRGQVEQVSMESVAELAGVSRGLLYKHFANRHELLNALYEREASLLYLQLVDDVRAADGFEVKLRTMIVGVIDAQQTRGATFAALNSVGARGTRSRQDRRRRDGETLRYFTNIAAAEFELELPIARTAVAQALGTISTALSQWRQKPTAEHAALIEETFVTMTLGGLAHLKQSHRVPAADTLLRPSR